MKGFWFCRTCDKPVEINVDGEQSRCMECNGVHLHFVELRRPRGRSRHGSAPVPTGERAHELFAAMRAAIEQPS